MMPSAAEWASIQADIEATSLPDTCTILSVTQVSDGQGGFTDTWGTVSASVPCRLDPVRGQEQQVGGAVQPFHTYVLSLEYGAAITAAYRVVVNSQTFNVRSVDTGKSWSGQVRAYVEIV
jgi:head-tail adaptor